MKIEMLKVDDIKPYEKNAKNHPEEQIEYIANSIKEFGFQQPLVVDNENVLVIGHGRLLASKKLNIEEVPVVRVTELSEEQIKALRLADNKTHESSWDEGLLELELFDITDIDMSKLGFTFDVEEEKKKEERKKTFEQMQLKAFEHYDYVVFVFKNQMDWLNVINMFGIKKVDAGYGKTKKVGVGRVIDGKRLLEKIQHKSSDNKQRKG